MALLKQSTAYTRTFKMIDSADHFSKKTGLTCTVNISKAGAAFGAAGGTVTEIANGWYKVALTTTDTNTLGDLSYYITATGADDTDFVDQVVAFDVTDAVRLGLTALPNANAGASGGLPTSGTGSNQIDLDSSGRVNIGKWLGTLVTAATAGIPDVNVKNWGNVAPNALIQGRVDSIEEIETGTAQSGSSISITLRAGASATDDIYTDSHITILSGTGAGQTRLITSYTGSSKIAVVSPNWQTNPGGTSIYAIIPFNRVDISHWLGTLTTAATAGIPDVNVKNINNVSTSSVTTISANQGTTQPINFTGTGASALVKSDTVDIAGAAVSTTVAQIGVNIVNVAADTAAAGNIANTFNGTGYVNANAPAQQQQVTNIAVTSAALNKIASSRTITTGSGVGGVANTNTLDSVYDSISDTTGTLDAYYEFDLSSISGAIAVGANWDGYLVGITNTLKIFAYNWGAAGWDQLGIINGISTTVNQAFDGELTSAHTGTGGNLGLVRIRFQNTGLTSATLKTDRILIGYVVVPTFPTNFSSLSIDASGRIDVGKILGTASAGAVGYVGIDWGQVTNKTTTNALTGTTISTTQVVASVTGAVGSVTTVSDKTGYSLGATGLDTITASDPAAVATTFPQMVVQTWRRFFKRSTLTSTQLKTYKDDNSTVETTQTVSDDGITQIQGPAA